MDTKIIRQKYIDILKHHVMTTNPSHENDKTQDELLRFIASPIYRMKQTSVTVNAIIDVQLNEGLTNDEARWLRDTWLY